MKSSLIFLFAVLSFSLSCSSSTERATSAPVTAPKEVPQTAEVEKTQKFGLQTQKVSLNAIDQEASTAEAADRKIIRNADITIEVPSTVDAQHQVTSIPSRTMASSSRPKQNNARATIPRNERSK